MKKQDVLWFLLIFMQWWQDILIDFIVNLSNNNDYMNIMIIIDWLIKIKHMISLKLLNIIEIVEIILSWDCVCQFQFVIQIQFMSLVYKSCKIKSHLLIHLSCCLSWIQQERVISFNHLASMNSTFANTAS